jgi:helicase
MGVNLPARKVVVYDNYAFDGDTFRPLPVERYLQFAGRAGRPGLDATGEAVLLAPVWDSQAERCLRGTPEPVRSGLFTSKQLAREVLYEVSSRLSVSEQHLEVNFAQRTLWRHQGGQKSLGATVRALVKGGLLKEVEKNERTYLSHTALGKIATQMSLSPGTIMLLSKAYTELHGPTDFDLLLIACLAEEATPKLGFNFEEIDHLGDLVQQASSHLLSRTASQVSHLQSQCTEQSLLSAVKCATILHAHTHLEDLTALAERFDCYPADLQSLKRNVAWVLEAAGRVFSVLNRQEFYLEHEDEEDPGKPPRSAHELVTEGLKLMVEYGVPKGAISLVRIDGIGPKRAQRLCAEDIFTAQQVAQYSAKHLADWLGLGLRTADRILASAKLLASASDPVLQVATALPTLSVAPAKRPFNLRGVDPYRLRRSLELRVDHMSAEAVRISGGTEPHRVFVGESALRQRSYICDCADFAKGHALCKHVLRAKMAMHDDDELRPIIAGFRRASDDVPLRYALGDLWMKAGKSYDTYFARSPEATLPDFMPSERLRRAR